MGGHLPQPCLRCLHAVIQTVQCYWSHTADSLLPPRSDRRRRGRKLSECLSVLAVFSVSLLPRCSRSRTAEVKGKMRCPPITYTHTHTHRWGSKSLFTVPRHSVLHRKASSSQGFIFPFHDISLWERKGEKNPHQHCPGASALPLSNVTTAFPSHPSEKAGGVTEKPRFDLTLDKHLMRTLVSFWFLRVFSPPRT